MTTKKLGRFPSCDAVDLEAPRAPGSYPDGTKEPSATRPGRRELSGRLAGLSLPRQVLVLAIWPLLEQFMSYLVGTVDLSLAGHLDRSLQVAATDALGVSGYVGWLMAMVHSSVGVGATAMIARATGGRHRGLSNAVVGQSCLLAVVSGLGVGVVIFAAAPAIGRTAGLEGLSLGYCVAYLRILAVATPFSSLLLIGSAALRGAGDTRTPFWVMVVVNAINIMTSWLLVFGPGSIGGWEVTGIAIGTAVAWTAGCVIIMTALLRGWGGIRLYTHRLRPHAHTLRRVVRIGAPALLESVVGMWLGNFVVLMIVGRLAVEGAIGAHMIAIRVESISFLSGYALSIAASTLVGQYLGLGNPQRAKQAVGLCWGVASVIMVSLGLVFLFAPRLFAGVITDSPVLIEQCVTLIQICGPIQIFFATHLVFSGALRGAGDTGVTMWMTSLSIYLVRLPAAYLLGVVYELGLNGVWLALCGELVLRGGLFAGRFWHGGWSRIEV